MGSLMRNESVNETRLYDDALRIVPLLADYFDLAGFRLEHNDQFHYFRLYPPDNSVEGEAGESVRRLHHRIDRELSAYVLALRHLYLQAAESGTLNDKAEHIVNMQDIVQALAFLLRRDIPKQRSERENLYRELRVLKLVRLPEGFTRENDDLMLSIRPTILDFVTEEKIRAWRARAEVRLAATAPKVDDPAVETDSDSAADAA
jgi:hypothetical protein